MAKKIKWTGKINKNMIIVKDYLKEANLSVTKPIGLNTDLTKGQVDRAHKVKEIKDDWYVQELHR